MPLESRNWIALFSSSGIGVAPTLAVDGITSSILGDADLSAPHDQAVEELSPALADGMPALDADYEYHTFRVVTSLNTLGRAFLFSRVTLPAE